MLGKKKRGKCQGIRERYDWQSRVIPFGKFRGQKKYTGLLQHLMFIRRSVDLVPLKIADRNAANKEYICSEKYYS